MANNEREDAERLISKLSTDLAPVRPLASPIRFAASLITSALAAVAVALIIALPRADLTKKLGDFSFDTNLLAALALLVTAIFLCADLRQPGRDARQSTVAMTAIGFFLLAFNIALVAVSFLKSPADAALGAQDGTSCSLFVCTTASAVAVLLFTFVRTGAPQSPLRLGAAVGLASFAAGCVGIAFHCGSDNSLHVTLWHLVFPATIVVALTASLGRKLLRW